MAYGIDEIICPYCDYVYEAEGNEVEDGIGETEWQCTKREEYFIIIQEIYTVSFGIESMTYEKRDEMQRKYNEAIKK